MDIEHIIAAHLKHKAFSAGEPVEITSHTDLIGEGIEDSLGIFTLISFLEERFRVHIEPEEVTLENFETVGSVAQLVRWKLEEQEKSA